MIIESGILPEGAVQLIVGSTGNILEQLGGQDVVSFTGSMETSLKLRAGLDNLRFLKPVVPGDTIRARLTVKQKAPRKPEYGEVRWDVEVTNQDGDIVAGYELLTLNETVHGVAAATTGAREPSPALS